MREGENGGSASTGSSAPGGTSSFRIVVQLFLLTVWCVLRKSSKHLSILAGGQTYSHTGVPGRNTYTCFRKQDPICSVFSSCDHSVACAYVPLHIQVVIKNRGSTLASDRGTNTVLVSTIAIYNLLQSV